jgi:hypothetical protein
LNSSGEKVEAGAVAVRQTESSSNEKRQRLLTLFTEHNPTMRGNRTGVWDNSCWDEDGWNDEDGIYQAMLRRLQELDKKSGKRRRDLERLLEGQTRDAKSRKRLSRRGLDCSHAIRT